MHVWVAGHRRHHSYEQHDTKDEHGSQYSTASSSAAAVQHQDRGHGQGQQGIIQEATHIYNKDTRTARGRTGHARARAARRARARPACARAATRASARVRSTHNTIYVLVRASGARGARQRAAGCAAAPRTVQRALRARGASGVRAASTHTTYIWLCYLSFSYASRAWTLPCPC